MCVYTCIACPTERTTPIFFTTFALEFTPFMISKSSSKLHFLLLLMPAPLLSYYPIDVSNSFSTFSIERRNKSEKGFTSKPLETLLFTSWPCPRPPRSTSWGWGTLSCYTLHLLCLFMLTVLMCYMIYFITAMSLMAMSKATKINFLRLRNFTMLYTASTLPFHSVCFDVLHDLL